MARGLRGRERWARKLSPAGGESGAGFNRSLKEEVGSRPLIFRMSGKSYIEYLIALETNIY